MTIIPFPKTPRHRHNDAKAQVWMGELFNDYRCPLMWKGDKYWEFLEPPRSVSFPICEGCGHIIWDWPHFEEEVPKNACCDECAEDL
jgi:hypothetical protein